MLIIINVYDSNINNSQLLERADRVESCAIENLSLRHA